MTILGEMLWEDALMEGMETGDLRRIVLQICKKLRKNQSKEEIADALEEDVSYIESICKVAEKYAPDYDEEKVCKELLELKRNNKEN